jgi:hypothetical protein
VHPTQRRQAFLEADQAGHVGAVAEILAALGNCRGHDLQGIEEPVIELGKERHLLAHDFA